MTFDEFVMVDWSGASRPATGANSVWVGRGRTGQETEVANPPTRRRAEALIGSMIGTAVREERRVLVGLDFSFGYPRGFARCVGASPERAPWVATCDLFAARGLDDETNANNRFAVAADLNAASGHALFWGRPRSAAFEYLDTLSARRSVQPAGLALNPCAPYRVTERWAGHGISSTFQLYGAGSVGGQTLTGLPPLWRLRQRFGDMALIWPLESRFTDDPSAEGRVVFAEIWPSLFGQFAARGVTRDEAQVRGLVEVCRSRDRAGWAEWFKPDLGSLDDESRRAVLDEEGWILGVTKEPAG